VDIFSESTAQKEKFRTCANKLLNSCFILKRKEDTRNDYIYLLQNKDYFIQYFDLLGYQLDINETYGVVSLISTSGKGRIRLKKNESILLLILRLLYIEKAKELRLVDDVVARIEEIHEKYDMLNINSKQKLDRTSLKSVFSTFKRYNLIQTMDRDITAYDARIIIYPSILFAITHDSLDAMYNAVMDKLDSYNMRGEDEDEEDEEDIMQD